VCRKFPLNSNLVAVFGRESIRSTLHHRRPSNSPLECFSICDSEAIDFAPFNLGEDWHSLGVLERLEKFKKFVLKVGDCVFRRQVFKVISERDAIGGSYLVKG
jgi:hypothetical protein